MKKIIVILLILLLAGCGEKSLGKMSDESITIYTAENFDPMSVLLNVEEGTEVSYELDEENSKLVITLTKDDQVQTLEKEVEIVKPLVVANENIVIDTYKGYDVNDLITVEEGTTVEQSLDEEAGILTITAKNGERVETVEVPVELTDSNPYPIFCQGTVFENGWSNETSYTFLSDTEVDFYSPHTANTYRGTYTKSYISEPGAFSIVSVNEYEFYTYSGEKNISGVEARNYYRCDTPHPFQNNCE